MLMHRELTSMENRDQDLIIPVPHSLRPKKFTPLSERIANNEVLTGVLRLKELMRMSDFTTYIESLVAVRLQDQVICLVNIFYGSITPFDICQIKTER